jgi:Cytochrome c
VKGHNTMLPQYPSHRSSSEWSSSQLSFSQPPPATRSTWFCRLAFLFTAAVALAVISYPCPQAFAQTDKPQHPGKPAAAGSDVARGKYIVEDVAMCEECHTPRDSSGNPDHSRRLQGAPILCLSPNHDPNWPLSAPRIGGTPPASDADMIKLLTTGVWTTGARLRFPMPQFRMERTDAEAVVAYLKSLTP